MSTNMKLKTLGSNIKTTKPSDGITRSDYYLGYPYTNWDPKKMSFDPPTNGTAKFDPSVKFREIAISYNYGTNDKPDYQPLEIELPFTIDPETKEVKNLVSSAYGVRLKKNKKQEEEEKKKAAKNKKSGKNEVDVVQKKYRVICNLDDKNPVHKKFIEMMREIYIECLRAMAKHLGSKFSMPACSEDDINERNDSGALRYPLMYKRADEGKGDVIVGYPPALDLSVCPAGMYATKFVGIENVTIDEEGKSNYTTKYYKFEEVLNRGFIHVPRFTVPTIFVGTEKILRLSCSQTLIRKFTNNSQASMGNTLDKFAAAGITTEETALAANFIKDLLIEEGAKAPIETPEVVDKNDSQEDANEEPQEKLKKPTPLAKKPVPVVEKEPEVQEEEELQESEDPEEKPKPKPVVIKKPLTLPKKKPVKESETESD